MGWHLRIRHATPFKDKARAIYTLFIFRLRCQIKLKSGILITALKDTTHTVLNHPLLIREIAFSPYFWEFLKPQLISQFLSFFFSYILTTIAQQIARVSIAMSSLFHHLVL